MIPGLEISEEVEERIWSAFGRWSSRFKSNLAAGGVPYLIDRYRKLVESVETRSCPHGPGGSRKTGRDWQSCCGLTYEFANSLSCRDALRVLEEHAPPEATANLRQEVVALDERLYVLYADPPARTGDWWNQGYPRGIINPGPQDLVGTWATRPSGNQSGEPIEEWCLHKDGTFTSRGGRQGGIPEGHGTCAQVGSSLEFTTELSKTAVDFWLRIDELLLYFRDGKVVRYFRQTLE